MATPLFLKSEQFGFFDITFVPRGGICPPGTQPQPVTCIQAPCPDVCLPAESLDLSGEPLAPELIEEPTPLVVVPGARLVPPVEEPVPVAAAGLGMLYLVGIGVVSLVLLAGARRPRR